MCQILYWSTSSLQALKQNIQLQGISCLPLRNSRNNACFWHLLLMACLFLKCFVWLTLWSIKLLVDLFWGTFHYFGHPGHNLFWLNMLVLKVENLKRKLSHNLIVLYGISNLNMWLWLWYETVRNCRISWVYLRLHKKWTFGKALRVLSSHVKARQRGSTAITNLPIKYYSHVHVNLTLQFWTVNVWSVLHCSCCLT